MNWFSGRLVPGVDPMNEESADELMNFGFITGDGSNPDAYFFATAYPVPNHWAELPLPDGAYWHTMGWIGAVLPNATVTVTYSPFELLID